MDIGSAGKMAYVCGMEAVWGRLGPLGLTVHMLVYNKREVLVRWLIGAACRWQQGVSCAGSIRACDLL